MRKDDYQNLRKDKNKANVASCVQKRVPIGTTCHLITHGRLSTLEGSTISLFGGAGAAFFLEATGAGPLPSSPESSSAAKKFD